ncbi:hypothetical protein BDB01DRAFT_778283 [Pilobolus umbonatus]|nr:hypothetical protein BDB01DRAFT_778283 [Pilobolus umbonatus]
MYIQSRHSDTHSVDDVIDLHRVLSNDGSEDDKCNSYRISLKSIDDNELRLFRRDLVTPAASVCYDDDIIHRSMFRHNNLPYKPSARSESVMLFKQINEGGADVSFDLISSDLKDFLDAESIVVDDIDTHKLNKAKSASVIHDVNKPNRPNQNRTPMNILNHRIMPFISKQSSQVSNSKRYTDYTEDSTSNEYTNTPQTLTNNRRHLLRSSLNEYNTESRPIIGNRMNRSSLTNEISHRDDYSLKQLTKKTSNLYINRESNKKEGIKQPIIYSNRNKGRYPEIEESGSNKIRSNRRNSEMGQEPYLGKSNGIRKSSSYILERKKEMIDSSLTDDNCTDEDESDLSSSGIVTPHSNHSPAAIAVNTTTDLYGDGRMMRIDSDLFKHKRSSGVDKAHPMNQVRYTMNTNRINSGYYSNTELKHEPEYKFNLSPRMKTIHVNNSNTIKSIPKSKSSISVTDSARHVLACIRERRKSSAVFMRNQERREITSRSTTDNQQRLITRKYDLHPEIRLLSRLPQRTCYR